MSAVLERFLRYVRYDTRADDRSEHHPSTPGQLVLLNDLAAELRAMGVKDAAVSPHGCVTATVVATSAKSSVPTIGLIAHVDTSPEMSGAGVSPIVHRHYDGGDIRLPDDPSVVLRAAEIPALADRIGDDIVTASGTTLLGADDKAGVAEIMTAVEYMVGHPEVARGPIRVAFTSDEEIGRGTRDFDVKAFGARYAYTLDGGARGDLEFESFSADGVTMAFEGFNTHPGYAKGRMVNALKAAGAFLASLPRALSPETTEGYEGFVHPYLLRGGVDRAEVRLIVRDFETRALAVKEALLEALARAAAAGVAGVRVSISIEEQYRNMREVLDGHPDVVECAREAMRRAGVTPRERPIRGGTDGSKLSFMGLPTPNLFAGQQNFHSRIEWVSVQDMEKTVDTIVQLAQVWEQRA